MSSAATVSKLLTKDFKSSTEDIVNNGLAIYRGKLKANPRRTRKTGSPSGPLPAAMAQKLFVPTAAHFLGQIAHLQDSCVHMRNNYSSGHWQCFFFCCCSEG